jgi:hypothetical protein
MQLKHLFIGISVVALTLTSLSQQDKSKRPSPPGIAEVTLKEKKVTIEYSRPSLRGRKAVGGDLVPYGKVCRTGANEATTLTTAIDLNIGGATVPAGKYTLYTLPSETGWKLIINKQAGQWGTVYDEKQDLVRVDMKTSQLSDPVEQFTILLEPHGDALTQIALHWENTQVSVPVRAW